MSILTETFIDVIKYCPYAKENYTVCTEFEPYKSCGGYICARKQAYYYSKRCKYLESKLDIKENIRMMSKYIIKNCPNYFKTHSDSYCDLDTGCCQDCTDCVMKQIVELCKSKDYFVKRFPNAEFSSGVQNSELAFDILQLLDIEEINK